MKTCTQCGKSFSDDPKFCNNCGATLAINDPQPEPVNNTVQPQPEPVNNTVQPQPVPDANISRIQPEPVNDAFGQQPSPAVNAGQPQTYYPQNAPKEPFSRGDFRTAPTGINIMSIIGFVLSFLCVGFVWISELSIIVFPVAIIALVLCTIVKAMKYDNIFAKIGFIVALVITIISGIVFGIYLYETVF